MDVWPKMSIYYPWYLLQESAVLCPGKWTIEIRLTFRSSHMQRNQLTLFNLFGAAFYVRLSRELVSPSSIPKLFLNTVLVVSSFPGFLLATATSFTAASHTSILTCTCSIEIT